MPHQPELPELPASATPRYCHLCGQAISGRYYIYGLRLVVCERCNAERPRCVRCNMPLALSKAEAARFAHPLCPECERSALRCACCHEAITGSFHRFEELVTGAEGRHFCARCVHTHPSCDLCHAPVPSPALPTVDGQYRCALCASQMVVRTHEAEQLYVEALRAVTGVMGAALTQAPTLALVGRRQMGEVRRRAERAAGIVSVPADMDAGADGTGYHVLGFFYRAGSAATIYAEVGLPRPLLLGTLAHEIGHAWQALYAPDVRDPLLCEGFAEWVAHHVLVARGHQTMAERATRRDDLYGRGLRAYLRAEQLGGRRAVVALMGGHPPSKTTIVPRVPPAGNAKSTRPVSSRKARPLDA